LGGVITAKQTDFANNLLYHVLTYFRK